MRLLNTRALERFARKHPDARTSLDAWRDAIEQAAWHNIQEARERYPSADGVKLASGAVVTVFNICGNKYRLLTSIFYDRQQALVLDILTHPEYDRQSWKGKL